MVATHAKEILYIQIDIILYLFQIELWVLIKKSFKSFYVAKVTDGIKVMGKWPTNKNRLTGEFKSCSLIGHSCWSSVPIGPNWQTEREVSWLCSIEVNAKISLLLNTHQTLYILLYTFMSLITYKLIFIRDNPEVIMYCLISRWLWCTN